MHVNTQDAYFDRMGYFEISSFRGLHTNNVGPGNDGTSVLQGLALLYFKTKLGIKTCFFSLSSLFLFRFWLYNNYHKKYLIQRNQFFKVTDPHGIFFYSWSCVGMHVNQVRFAVYRRVSTVYMYSDACEKNFTGSSNWPRSRLFESRPRCL